VIEGRNTETNEIETYVLGTPTQVVFTPAVPYRADTLSVFLNGLRLVSAVDFVSSDDGPITLAGEKLYPGDTVQLRYTPRATK
jgi:hypothetical protein